jgi:hypothetical protein
MYDRTRSLHDDAVIEKLKNKNSECSAMKVKYESTLSEDLIGRPDQVFT